MHSTARLQGCGNTLVMPLAAKDTWNSPDQRPADKSQKYRYSEAKLQQHCMQWQATPLQPAANGSLFPRQDLLRRPMRPAMMIMSP